MFLFDVASRHMTWLAGKQSVTAVNVANADTPGYRARTTVPFSALLDGVALPIHTTSSRHLALSTTEVTSASEEYASDWGSTHSGNNVSLENELLTASSTSRMMSIDAGLARSFHWLLLASVKV